MKNLKNKKFVICCILIVIITFGLLIYNQIQAQRIEEYQKYCQNDCELDKVSKMQLEETINNRQKTAIDNIIKYQTNIEEVTKYLTEQKLNDEEKKKLESLVLVKEYEVEVEYTVDELIELESSYSELSQQMTDLKTNFRTRYLTAKINSNSKSISATKKSLKNFELTDAESKTQNDLDKKLKFKKDTVYRVEQLSDFNIIYKTVKKDYTDLLKKVEERVKQEEIQENVKEVDSAQATTNNSSYNSNNSSKTSSSNNNSSANSNDSCYDSQGRFNSACATGEYNGNANELPPNICPYKSEADAINVAENQLKTNGANGYSTLPCSEGTWEIYWK